MKHVAHPIHDGDKGPIGTLCGEGDVRTDWIFQGLDHAFAAIHTNSTAQPCTDCLTVAIKILTEGPQ